MQQILLILLTKFLWEEWDGVEKWPRNNTTSLFQYPSNSCRVLVYFTPWSGTLCLEWCHGALCARHCRVNSHRPSSRYRTDQEPGRSQNWLDKSQEESITEAQDRTWLRNSGKRQCWRWQMGETWNMSFQQSGKSLLRPNPDHLAHVIPDEVSGLGQGPRGGPTKSFHLGSSWTA